MKYMAVNRTYILTTDNDEDLRMIAAASLQSLGEWCGPDYVIPAEYAAAILAPEDMAHAHAQNQPEDSPW